MSKIKTALINLLGGITQAEAKQSAWNSYNIGRYKQASAIKKYADSLNGRPADEWCKLMYEEISQTLINLENDAATDPD